MPRANDTLLTTSREHEAAENRLRRSEAYLVEAQRLTKTGSWAWTPGRRGELEGWHYWSDEMFRIFEFDPRKGLPTREMWWQRIHPEDRQQMDKSVQKALEGKGEYVNDYRFLCPAQEARHPQKTEPAGAAPLAPQPPEPAPVKQ